jgi:hypothetical protein
MMKKHVNVLNESFINFVKGSLFIIAIVRELGIVHLVSNFESYKKTFRVVTQALGMISELPIKVGNVQCRMTFMIMDTDSYDLLVGLDFFIKIGVAVDMEKGLIQVKQGPKNSVQILPLNMVNMLQLVTY